jgi:hypothetical protein
MGEQDNRQVLGLSEFRSRFYACLGPWPDTLFELCEALLCAPGAVGSLPRLSLEPIFRRGHSSLYRALAQGGIDQGAFYELLLAARPPDWPLVFAVDTSAYPRSEAEVSPEREICYVPRTGGAALLPGYLFSVVAQLSFSPDSWTAPVSGRRLGPGTSRTAQTLAQLWAICRGLPKGSCPLFVFDAGYNSAEMTRGLAGSGAATLTRLQFNQVLCRDVPAPAPSSPKPNGRPRVHGARLACADLGRLPPPDQVLTETGPRGPVVVYAWHGVHLRRSTSRAQVQPVSGSLITVQIEARNPRSGRLQRPLRLFWSGPGVPDLNLLWRAYLHRFDLEHTFRCWKRTLGWTVPRLQQPTGLELWTALLLAAYTQLRLARATAADLRLPWQRPAPSLALSPGRVRQGFCRLARSLPGLPKSPKPARAGPGWPRGRKRAPKPRCPAFKRRL